MRLTRRLGACLIFISPILFLLSGLFLANTLMFPPESLPYQVGRVLCFGVAPVLLASGALIYLKARSTIESKRTTPVHPAETDIIRQEPAEGIKQTESSPKKNKIRAYTKAAAILGLMIAVVSTLLAIAFSDSMLLNGVLVGIYLAVASWLVRKFERGLILRRLLGSVMLILPTVPMLYSGPFIIPLMCAPGIIIALYMVTSRRRGIISAIIVLSGAILYAAVWLLGLFPGPLIDGTWSTVLNELWSPRFYYENRLDTYISLWALQLEKALALVAGAFLLFTSILSRRGVTKLWAGGVVLAISLLPLLLLAPTQLKGIEGWGVLKVKVKTVDGIPVSGLEVDLGEKPGAPPEGGLVTSDENGLAAFYVQPGSYVLYFNMVGFPSDLEYPKKLYPVHVSPSRWSELTVSVNYTTPLVVLTSDYKVRITPGEDPNATSVTSLVSGGAYSIWVQGPKGVSLDYDIYIHAQGTGLTDKIGSGRLDPSGEPVRSGFGLSVGSLSEVVIEVRIQRKVAASVTVTVG